MTTSDVRQEILVLMDEAIDSGCRQHAICKKMGLSIRSVQNWRKNGIIDKRKGSPKKVGNKLNEEERQEVISTACMECFRDLPPCAIVPILAEEGRYIASESTFYRILREENLIIRKPKNPSKNIPVILQAEGPNRLWSWDITYLRTIICGTYYYLYLVIDVWSRAIMGWEIHESEDKRISSAMLSRLCGEHGIDKDTLTLHSDNGGPMKNATMFAVLEKLGVTQSFSRPSVSNDNPYSESLFHTLKYRAGYPSSFRSLEQAKEWVSRFVEWYNFEHHHSAIGFVTPMERHKGLDIEILSKRQEVYDDARAEHPERWSRHCRKWERTEVVYLKKGNQKKKCA
jgi:putative transposase